MHNDHDDHQLQPSYGLTDATLNTNPDDEPPLLLPLTRFAHLHLQHILSHPPDSVLFPFLHGLEGDNHAQNTFFSSSSSPSPSPSPSSFPPHPSIATTTTTTSSSPPPPPSPTPSSSSTSARQRTGKPVRVPRYRGLVWVVCEDDLDAEPGRYARELGVLRRKRDGGFGDMDVDTDSGVDTGTDAGGGEVGGTSVNGLPGTPALEGGGSESEGSSDFEEDEEDDEDEDEDVDVDVDVGVGVGVNINVSVGGGEECMRVDVVPGDAMDVDGPGTRDTIRLEIVNNRTGEVGGKEDEGKHMHPVVARPAPIQTANLPPSFLSTTSSDGLSTSFTSTGSSDCESNFSFSPLDNTTAPPPPATNPDLKPTLTTAPTPNPTSIKPTTSVPIPAASASANGNATPNGAPEDLKPSSHSPSHSQPQPHPEQEQTQTQKPATNPPPTADLALLTCTFRPSEILRRVVKAQRPTLRLPAVNGCGYGDGHGHVPGEYIEGARSSPLNDGEVKEKEKEGEKEGEGDEGGGWEFVPARVPDGISLRNFGIQVPIYATLSDIVVYSPKGPTPNALALARRLKEAVRRKWEERVARLGGFPDAEELDAHGQGQRKHHPDLLNYNVFVLNATAAEMQADAGVPHLVMRLCGGGVPGAVSAASVLSEPGTANGTWGAKANGVANGHAIHPGDEEEEWEGMCFDGDADTDMDVDHFTTTTATARCHATPVRAPRIREPNTVDFAQREKEEMRDLTKASEIICVGPPSPTSTLTNANMNIDTNANTTSTPADEASASSAKWKPHVGQVFLGNSDDVPLAPDVPTRFRHASVGVGESESRSRERGDQEEDDPEDPFNYRPTNDPEKGYGYDICIECHDLAPFPTSAHLRAAEEHLAMLDVLWEKRVEGKDGSGDGKGDRNNGTQTRRIPPRPPPNANAVIHLPFPSSPTNTQTAMNALMPVIRFLEKWLAPVVPPPPAPPPPPPVAAPPPSNNSSGSSAARRWSSVTALMPHFPFPGSSSSSSSSSSSVPPPPPIPPPTITTAPSRMRSLTSPAGHPPAPPPAPPRTRPIKILLYSADGYTESSVPALCLLMAVKHLTLPEAYLELQVTRRRSFFVYHQDLAVLRRVESRLREDAERVRVERERERVERELMEKKREREERERERERARVNEHAQTQEQETGKESEPEPGVNGNGKRVAAAQGSWGSVMGNGWRNAPKAPQGPAPTPPGPPPTMGRPAAKSVSFAQAPGHIQPVRSPPMVVPSQSQSRSLIISGTPPAQGMQISSTVNGFKGRPRANTSPWLPSVIGAHHTWFNDQRFDGSFPSRVLPFLYLGNLNHAANAYMLHALGITHVVSVGECALVPPPHHQHAQAPYHPPSSSPFHHPGPNVHYIQGKGPGQGSLWHEEREGRIKVLDIKGVCDDGIDTLEPQLEPICDWIDQARVEGGQVLVHCRVGVSRSATVTIAYVMKHLGLPLVDAYLIVRSRRLSVLIQPNMRLLYNLCGWEIKLAKARAGDNEDNLRRELARTLSWPYLAKEVHALNEKYLH